MTAEDGVHQENGEQLVRLRALAGELREVCRGVRDEATRLSRGARRRTGAVATALAAAAQALEAAAASSEALVEKVGRRDRELPPS